MLKKTYYYCGMIQVVAVSNESIRITSVLIPIDLICIASLVIDDVINGSIVIIIIVNILAEIGSIAGFA